MAGYAGALGMLIAAVLGVGLLYLLSMAIGRAEPAPAEPLRAAPFESGSWPAEHAYSRFHARWYAMTLLFLAFDVEMLFMYPWALIVAEVGTKAVVEMFGFLVVLMVGVVYAWRQGALRWS